MDGETTRKTITRRSKDRANYIPSPTTRWKNVVSSKAFTHSGLLRRIPPRKMGNRTDAVRKTKTTTRIGTHGTNMSVPPTWYTPFFGGKVSIESKRERKLLKRACLNVDTTDGLIADPKFPPWSHREISFNRQDQWAAIPEPGSGSSECSLMGVAPSTSYSTTACLLSS